MFGEKFKLSTFLMISKWASVGVLTAGIDLLVFVYVFKSNSSIIISNLISSTCALLFNYSLHYFWSFKSNARHKFSSARYLLNLIIFWTTNTFLLKILIFSGLPAYLAKIVVISTLAPFSFISLKYFVFKK